MDKKLLQLTRGGLVCCEAVRSDSCDGCRFSVLAQKVYYLLLLWRKPSHLRLVIGRECINRFQEGLDKLLRSTLTQEVIEEYKDAVIPSSNMLDCSYPCSADS